MQISCSTPTRRLWLRAARAAALSDTAAVAAAAGTDTEALLVVLRTAHARGRCAFAVGAAALTGNAAALAHRACPPPFRRSKTPLLCRRDRAAARETAGWAARGLIPTDAAVTRPAMIRAASDPNSDVAQLAAAHPLCPPAVLTALASSRSIDVRDGVADNPACPPQALALLAADRDVTSSAITNPWLPLWTIKRLAAHPEEELRGAVAGNPAFRRR